MVVSLVENIFQQMVPTELVDILINLGFNCVVNYNIIVINRLELPYCKKSYNYTDLSKSFKDSKVFATFCTYDYRNEFKQQMRNFLIKEKRERKLNDILNEYRVKY